VGLQESGTPGGSGPRSLRGLLTDAHGRDHLSKARWRSTRTTRSGPAGENPRQFRRLYVAILVGVPTYLYATLLSGQYNIPAIHAEVVTGYTNTAPVDAYRGAGRPRQRPARTLDGDRGAAIEVDPADCAAKNFITQFPIRRR